MMYTYKIHLHKEDDSGFTAIVPALPGCITYGEDIDEAIAMAKEAIELYKNCRTEVKKYRMTVTRWNTP